MDGKCLMYEASNQDVVKPLALCWVAMNIRVEIKRRKDGRYQI